MRSMKKYAAITGLALSSLWLCGSIIKAEDPPKEKDVTRLEEVVVTATRSEKDITEVPANITVITEDDIKKSGAQTVPDVLRTEAGVLVRDYTGSGKTVNVDIRGFGETGLSNVLVLLDGRRVTQIDLSGTDWSQIPLDQVSRIEVIRGANSVLYGDNAAGGVINIITKKGQEKTEHTIRSTSGSYHSNLLLAEASGRKEKFSYRISSRYYDTEGYRDNSEFYTRDTNARFTIDAADYLKLDFSLGGHNDYYRLPGYLYENEINQLGRKASTTPNDRASTDDLYYQIQIKNPLDKIGTFITDISLRNRQSDWKWVSFSLDGRDEIDSIHISPRYILESKIAAIPFKLTSGVDLLKNTGDIKRDSYDPAWIVTDDVKNKKDGLGIYALGEFTLSKSFNLSLGLRRERVKYHFDGVTVNQTLGSTTLWKERKTHRRGVSQIGLTYLYQTNSSVYFNLAQSFRFPAVDEFFNTFSGLNTELSPQKGNQIEVGVKHTFSPQLFGSLSLFQMDIRDEIFYNKLNYANENYDKTRHQGIEMYLSYYPLETLETRFNYSYTDADFRGGTYKDNDIPGVPPHKASITLNKEVTEELDGILQAYYVDKRYMISDLKNVADEMDAYTTVDTKIMYRWKNLTAFIGVNNLFNQKYEEYGVTNAAATVKALYPSPERNYTLGVSMKF